MISDKSDTLKKKKNKMKAYSVLKEQTTIFNLSKDYVTS
jgi:hypothetical protein